MGRFLDPMYYLTSPISWRPNSQQSAEYQQVEVPAGFVTDLASIPRIFWSALRPDGKYAHAAVVHDYLYWMQTTPRGVADSILKFEMQDLGIGRATISEIYWAVRAFGQSAWRENVRLKAAGEKRLLKTYPSDPSITWDEWKKRSDVFS